MRRSDRERLAPGQLGLVRVGVDRRSVQERNGRPPLEAGIYALCEVESAVFSATGASDEFCAPEATREPGGPTVTVRYLRSYLANPLTISRLRDVKPDLSPMLLNEHQASSFPISGKEFRSILDLLGERLDDLPGPILKSDLNVERLKELEAKYLSASPEVKERLSRAVERGPIGAQVKQLMGFKCQICESLGRDPVGFRKRSGEPYVEAHHVMPVAFGEVGSLAASNVMTVCANHHRQMHYGDIDVRIEAANFSIAIDGNRIEIPRIKLSD